MSIGARISEARSRVRPPLSQDALAKQLGVQAKTIQRWENDKHAPHASELDGLARALSVSLDWLVRGEGDGPSADCSEPAA